MQFILFFNAFFAANFLTFDIIKTAAMNAQPAITHITHAENTPEIKRPLPRLRPIEDLSEWELARETSKTWSMEQD